MTQSKKKALIVTTEYVIPGGENTKHGVDHRSLLKLSQAAYGVLLLL